MTEQNLSHPPAKWPGVLGIIAMIFGGLGVLSIPMQFMQKTLNQLSFQGLVVEGMVTQEQVDAFIEKWAGTQMMVGLAGGAVSIVLLIGGILLYKRKPLGRTIMNVWAVLFIVQLIAGTYIMGDYVGEQLALMFPAGGVEEEAFVESIMTMAKAASWIGSGIFLAVPIFVLVFMNRAKVKEEVSRW